MLQATDVVCSARERGITDARVVVRELITQIGMTPERANMIARNEGFEDPPLVATDATGRPVAPGWPNDF